MADPQPKPFIAAVLYNPYEGIKIITRRDGDWSGLEDKLMIVSLPDQSLITPEIEQQVIESLQETLNHDEVKRSMLRGRAMTKSHVRLIRS